MHINNIIDEWSKDSIINSDDLSDESLREAKLYSKYSIYRMQYNLKLKEFKRDMKILKKNKLQFFNGTAEIVSNFIPLKSDIPIYIDSENEVIQLQKNIDLYEEYVHFIDGILKQISNRGFQINNYIKWNKFLNGD